jgi:UDP-glucose 4-epimerase
MKTLLITGANGFVGQHLSRMAVDRLSKNYKVVLLVSNAPKIPIADFILHKNYTFTRQDFIDSGLPIVNAVIHLGSAVAYSAARARNLEQNERSFLALSHLLKHLPSVPETFLFTSSLDVYKDPAGATERSAISPKNEYVKSKICCEALVSEWSQEKGVVHQILRLGHVFGPGEERFIKLIPNLIRTLKRCEVPELVTSGEELRAFIHVRDCSRMILSALGLKSSEGVINIASVTPRQVREVAEILIKISGIHGVLKRNLSNRGIDVFPSAEKMSLLLGKEEEDFETSLCEEYEGFDNSIQPG